MTEFAPSAGIQDEVMAFLLSSPTPEQIIEFKVSESAQQRLRYLLDGNRNGTLTPDEIEELDVATNVNHFMMRLKAEAHLKAGE